MDKQQKIELAEKALYYLTDRYIGYICVAFETAYYGENILDEGFIEKLSLEDKYDDEHFNKFLTKYYSDLAEFAFSYSQELQIPKECFSNEKCFKYGITPWFISLFDVNIDFRKIRIQILSEYIKRFKESVI